MFSDVNISQGNVATPLRNSGICSDLLIANLLVYVLCNSERILKIGHYLVKLWTRVCCLVLLTHGVLTVFLIICEM